MVAGIVAGGGAVIELSPLIFIEPIESPLLLLLQPATASSNATPKDESKIRRMRQSSFLK
jgi:hypothetical protein